MLHNLLIQIINVAVQVAHYVQTIIHTIGHLIK
jgi:hypothetical protein